MTWRWVLSLAVWLPVTLVDAQAERLVTSVSNQHVRVTSNFTGENLVLFGTVEQEALPITQRGAYDIVVMVTGPRQTLVTRRKERVVGIWANVDSRTFIDVPSYLAVLTTRPAAQIANRDTLLRQQVGIDNFILTQRIGADFGDVVREDPFRRAFIRIKSDQGLYLEQSNAVTFLSPTLFRADIPLPAEVPFGMFQIEVKLFSDGAMVARDTSAMEVLKVGFEQFVATAARSHGFIYGFATAAMALLTGWFASVIFRRD